jgi:hypothetical protein
VPISFAIRILVGDDRDAVGLSFVRRADQTGVMQRHLGGGHRFEYLCCRACLCQTAADTVE